MRQFVWILVSVGIITTGSTGTCQEEEKSFLGGFHYFLAGGTGIPISNSSDFFDIGWGASLGVGFRFTDRLAAQVDYMYSSYDIKSDIIPDHAAGIVGNQRLQWSTLNVSYEFVPSGNIVNIRAHAGPGIYWRRVSIEEVTGVESVTFCAPGTFVCYPSPTTTTEVIGARSSTDFGLNFGFNLSVSLGYPTRIYLEPRFHFIFGPIIETPSGARRANGYFIPVVLGFDYF